MADFFDIDYEGQVENLITPTKRYRKILDYLFSIVFPLQYLRDRTFDDYKKGASYADYSSGTTYAMYDRVIFTDRGVYESNTDSNVGNNPSNDTANWRKIQDVYIGADERVKYNGQIIVLLAALNKWFNVPGPDLIYLVNNNIAGLGFDLYVPSAVYNALGPNNTERDTAIYQFMNKYICAGTNNDIISY